MSYQYLKDLFRILGQQIFFSKEDSLDKKKMMKANFGRFIQAKQLNTFPIWRTHKKETRPKLIRIKRKLES